MSSLKIERKELLKMIQNCEISPEDGLAFLKKFDSSFTDTDIAVVGMSCRCAGASDPEEFWSHIKKKSELIKKETTEKGYVYTCGLPEKYCFDNDFFHISPREAMLMDPQQRIFLEESWKALENAGYSEDMLNGAKCGVFVGVSHGDYEKLVDKNDLCFAPETTTSLSVSVLASRLSYYLALNGPALAVDTACSSSAVALHYAIHSILADDCDMAVVGGVAILTTYELLIKSNIISMTSPNGKCAAFDESANGTVFADGVNAIVIKRLSDAKKCGDRVLGVIKATAVNNNGKTNGLTAPSAKSQAALIRELYHRRNIDPRSVSFIETHGTGTPLGDPIEFRSLKEIYDSNEKKNYCALGSNKSVIGHTMAASGIFNVLSVIQAMQHRTIPPIANYSKTNPRIDLQNSAFYISEKPEKWECSGRRLTAVNSFGFSGTNVHMVIEEAPERTEFPAMQERYLIPISAKTEDALKRNVSRLAEYLNSADDSMLPDIEYTLTARRSHFLCRACFIASDIRSLVSEMKDYLGGRDKPIANGDTALDRILRSFLAGEAVSYSDFRSEKNVQTVSLPSYAFERNEFCVGKTGNSELERIKESVHAVEGYCVKRLTALMNELGLFADGERTDLRYFKEKIRLIPKYEKLFHRMTMILDEYKVIRLSKTYVEKLEGFDNIISECRKTAFSALFADIAGCFPDMEYQLTLADMCFKSYADVLNGRIDSVQVMFPDGDVSYVEAIYKKNAIAEYFNSKLADSVAEEIISSGRKLRILEIGAGTGSSTAAVLSRSDILDRIEEYCFTDISAKFLNYGKSEFGKDYPFMKFEILDIENQPKAPFKSGYYDILIATNVLHATRKIKNTLKNSAYLLADGGKILINEVVRYNLFSDLTFGTLDGWWMFDDPENRMEGTPVLSPEKWTTALTGCGFDTVSFKCDDACNKYDMKQNVISAVRRVKEKKRSGKKINIVSEVTAVIAGKLMIPAEKIQPQKMFRDYGLDSITSVEVVNELNSRFGIVLKATDIFKYSNVETFSKHISSLCTDLEVLEEIEPVPVQNKAAESVRDNDIDKIAIVGVSVRYAGVDNISDYWDVIKNAKDNVREMTRWDSESFFDPDPDNKTRSYSKWCGMMDNIYDFDNKFFGIINREAELMDPEHRVFLEEAYHAFEDAGYTRKMLSGKRCGVYIGCGGSCYDDNIRNEGRNDDAYVFTGNIPSVLPARISYFMNLRGPAIAVNTACSSSMVAIHLAFQSILSGENDIALTGGISLLSNPDFYILTSRGNMLSPTGKCWAFDSRADGFVPGEGIGLLVLKKLSQAKKDGDYIYGIIKGSGMNQDGKSNGITSPNANAQTALEKEVYGKYNIDVNDIGYIEAHGTGTKLGDPIEIDALNDAFRSNTNCKGYCALGSVKANIGHSMAAAGAAGVIKSLLVLKKKVIPPLCNFRVQNPYLNIDDSPFYIPCELKEWEARKGAKRLSAVSSFGISGTNVHMVLEEYEDESRSNRGEAQLFVLSSGTEKNLSEYCRRLDRWLEENPGSSLEDIAYTLAVRRDHYSFRAAVTAYDRDTLSKKLRRLAQSDRANGTSDIDTGVSAKLREAAEKFLDSEPVEWSGIYSSGRNVPLPGYVFNRKTFNVDKPKTGSNEYILSECDWVLADDALTPSHRSQDVMIIYSSSQKQTAEELKASITDSFILMNCIDDIKEDTSEHVLSLMGSKIVTVIDLCDINENADYAERLRLLQKMIVKKNLSDLRYLHITCRLETFWIGGSSTVNGTVMSSFAKTLGDEYKRISTLTVDCNNDLAVCECAGRLLKSSWNCGSLCFRSGKFYEAVEKQLNVPPANAYNAVSANTDGTVLITGAFGGIGRFLVRKLAEIGYRKFALFCRTPAEQLTGEKKALLDFLEDRRLKYMIYSGSITDRSAMNSFSGDVKRRLGEIVGVIDLAGNSNDNSEFAFIKKDIDKMDGVFEPKIQGTEALFEAFDSLSLKYFIMFSSISAVYSKLSVGISTYAAANAYLNSFARSKYTSGDHRIKSICWSDWNINGIGKVNTQVFQNMGFCRLEPDKAFELMLSAVSAEDRPVVIATRRSSFVSAPLSRREAPAAIKKPAKTAEICGTNDLSAVKRLLLDVFAEEMKMTAEEIPTNETFTDIGMDSIILTEIIKELERKFGIVVDPNNMFEYPTIDKLSVKMKELIPADMLTAEEKTASDGSSKSDYRNAIAKVLAGELRMEVSEIKPEESFQEMGVDSIILAEIVKNMERSFGTVIDPNILLEYPSLEKLTNHFFNSRIPINCINKERSAAATVSHNSAEVRNRSDAPAEKITGSSEKVAVIGIACHFPGAANKEKFWKNLVDGIDSVTEIPPERWSIDEFYSSENAKGKTNSKWGGFIKGIENFDPEYFGFKKADGVKFDPLIRQFLEVSAETINDAGYTKKDIWGKNVAVYAGARTGNYTAMSGDFEKNTIIGTGQNFVAAHVSHVFNLTGASMTVDSACSSSLSAVHLAFNSLISGESEFALAGGVDILLNEEPYLIMGSCGALSPDGKCKTFDVSANGFVPGEGCGAVLLKRYEDAVRDGDYIYAVIEASAINNDGNTMGVTTPNPEAQKSVICNAIEKSGIDPQNIVYIETHGTGTLIGDPIELKSLTSVFSQYTDKKQYCAVGSVKTNIGHLLSASGIASFIKCCLIADNKFIPRTLNCENANPRFDFENSPFYPELAGEKYCKEKMTVGVSSFGFGGTNVHQLISSCKNSAPKRSLPDIIYNRERYWNDKAKSSFASAMTNAAASLFQIEPEFPADSSEGEHRLFKIEISER